MRALRREHAGGVAGALALGVVALLGADSGGYFPPVWNVATALVAWVALIGVITRRRIDPGRAETWFVVALVALTGWNLTTALWSPSLQAPLLDGQRTLLYVAVVAMLVVWADRTSPVALLAGAGIGGFLVSGYALVSRLRPDAFGLHDDPVAKGRLYQPIGYWNALGIYAAMTALLALGCAMRARRPWVRACAGASVPPLATTVYFTYSRGSMLAGLAGLAIALAMDRRWLRSLTAALVLVPWTGLAVGEAASRGSLDRSGVGTAHAAAAGRPVLLVVLACAAAAAASIVALDRAEGRVEISSRLRTGYVAGLGLAALVALALTFARFGGPQTIVVHAVEDLGSRAIVAKGSQNARLLSLSLNGRPALWRAAVSDFRAHPLAGSGAGTFEQYWLQHRPRIYVSRYAHSLYLESLAEGGIVRLLLVAAVFGIPLAAAVRLRGDPHVLTAGGAFLAYLFHAGFDWDWEVPAVTAVALVCAVAILVRERGESRPSWSLPLGRILPGVSLAAALVVGVLCWHGNDALARSADAQVRGDWPAAASDAHTAVAWMPWSDAGNLMLAVALEHTGDVQSARGTLRQATRRNPADWAAWQQLADVTSGGEHARALARAEALNPKGMRRLLHQRRRQARGLPPRA
jgi:O-Antigen ligase/Tetratricopeptide repeat